MKRLLAAVVCSLALASCASGPPAAEEFDDRAEFFSIERPDGVNMPCVKVGASSGSGDSKIAYLAMSCDWALDYDGPVDPPSTGGEL